MGTIPERLPTDIELAERHQKLLQAAAIDLDVAVEAGVRTVSGADELPDELAWASERLPGLLFFHHRVDDTADPVPQLRPDDPGDAADAPKYLLPRGSGAVISCHPRMAERIGNATRAVIVEGTKQHLAAVSSAPDDWLVVGIQGCRGWMADGVASPGLDVIARGAEVTIVFDADVASNRDVHDAAKQLGEHLRMVGAAKVAWASIPAGGKAGLDDWLAGRPAEHRQEAFTNLVTHAVAKLPRPPARKRAVPSSLSVPLGARVDEAAGVIRGPEIVTETGVRPGPILFGGTARIVATEIEVDDLAPPADQHQRVTRRLVLGVGGVEIPVTEPVADRHLERPTEWLAQTPDAIGRSIFIDPGARTGETIAGAILRHRIDECRSVTVRPRTGWLETDEGPVWLHCGGGIGPNGPVADVRARVAKDIRIPDDACSWDQVDAASVILETARNLVDPTPWWAMIGQTFWAFAGGDPKGSIVLRGGDGSGKSSLTAAIASMEGVNYAPGKQPMASANASDAGLSVQGHGIHNAVVVIDDFHDPQSAPARLATANRLDDLLRRSYSGQAAGKNKATVDEGSVVAAKPDFARPSIIISADWMPDLVPSAIARLSIIRVTEFDTWVTGGYDAAKKWGSEGRYAAAAASYISWVARQMVAAGGFEAWKESVEQSAYASVDDLLGQLPPSARRHREVLATILGGLGLAMAWLGDTLGELPAEVAEQARRTVLYLAESRQASREEISVSTDALEGLKSKISAGDLFLVSPGYEERPGARCVGRILALTGAAAQKFSVADGTEVVAIDRKRAAQELGASVDTLQAALLSAGLLLTSTSGTRKEVAPPIRIRDQNARRWLIRRDHWDASGVPSLTESSDAQVDFAGAPRPSAEAPSADSSFDGGDDGDSLSDDPLMAAILAGKLEVPDFFDPRKDY